MEVDLERSPLDLAARLREQGPALARICAAFGVASLGVFGSHARGTPHPASDVDLSVDFGREVAPHEELDFLGAICDALESDRVDVVNLRSAGPLVGREIGVHGVPIYEEAGGAFARAQLRALARSMDTARFRRLRGELLRQAAGP